MKYEGMFYEIKGSGDPIIFLPGIGAIHRMFAPQVSYLSEYFMTITLDLRGTGLSSPFKCLNPWKYIELHAKSIIDLMDHLEIEQATIVGVSYGGIVAQEISFQNPKRVNKLVLLDSYAHVLPRNLNEYKLLLFGTFVTLSTWLPTSWLKRFFSFYDKWELAHAEMLWVLENRKAWNVTLQLIGVFGINNLQKLSQLNIPVLGLVGDFYPTVVDKTKEIIDAVQNGQLVIVEDAFDPCNLCSPALINETLHSFLEEQVVLQTQPLKDFVLTTS
jgi:3-oxoadipate enol-lactonase